MADTSLGASGSETEIEAFELFLVAAWAIGYEKVAWCGMVSHGVTGRMSRHVTSLGQRACREGLCSPCPTLCGEATAMFHCF